MGRPRSSEPNVSHPGPDPASPKNKALNVADNFTVGLVDPRLMIREAICNLFRSAEPCVTFLPAPSATHLTDGRLPSLQLLVLHVGSHTISCAWAQSEMRIMACSGAPYVVLSDCVNMHEVNAALAMGARGYIPTSYPVRVAAGAMRLVRAGEVHIPAEILQDKALLGSFPLSSGRGEGDAWKEALTQRERTVFALICEGRRNKEVGAQLKIAEATVKIHVKNIMKKLGVNNRTMLVALASGRIGYARSSDHNNLTLGM